MPRPRLASSVEIVAHRGASHDAPENTLAAFRLAWVQGADACELDIQMTRDGQLAVIHDASTKRTAGRDAPVRAQTMAELRELSAGAWKHAQWTGEKIPTLAEALALIPDERRQLIEIKGGPEILPELQRILRASGKSPHQLALISFQAETVQQARALLPQIEAYWIVATKNDASNESPPLLATLIEQAKFWNLTGLDLDSRFAPTTDDVAAIHAAGLKLQIWTVDDPAIAQQLAAAGVDGIATNRPAQLLAHRNSGVSPASP